ncbi:NAD-dependent succinate-semialdehyde dehydrogenase [Paraburkholderia caribensis]|uniref:NAD-dependent succinate-semialdehyde dehydrogenase n=1 Tax=Paraburkholderia TaxID=1822464 RepID=UPI001CB5400B|nr:NAD-dependent succinate-semialdehyde dehydrogenase [Paraburkholderia caribensis]BEU25587.1 NAD-dependent succinate-semialdehyde dehydrogenase [Paraburkholderia sp. 22B1P]CAG9262581.1 Succinate-semialdehyde dehydrogenase (NADP(+)) [Paraburkholderia caribensis]
MAYQSINPANEEVVFTAPDITDEELELALATAHQVYENTWRRLSVSIRAEIVGRAAEILRKKTDELANHLVLEMGKRIGEARLEVQLSANILEYYAKNAERFLEPQTLPEAPDAEVHIEPIGILVGIEPWNFPYYQIARVVGPQLALGNVILLKHAENVPQSALAFAKVFEEAGAPKGVYTNIFATIEQIGRVIEDDRVRGVTLTGSERAGAAVAERAGRSLKKVVLELGGSDPLIVLDDAPLEWVISSAVSGRIFNAGQACIGTKRIIVVGKERAEEFLGGFVEKLSSVKIGDPADPETILGPVSSQKALDHLLRQIDLATDAGGKVVTGGKRVDRAGYFLEPTVLTDIKEDNPIYTQELFGPVVSFYAVDSEEEAIKVANSTPYGLGGSVFTADVERGREVAVQLDTGMVFINQPFRTAPELPFGGVKNSGFGRELSDQGVFEFANRKLINVAPVLSSPFGAPNKK